jgi:hypothetical protein
MRRGWFRVRSRFARHHRDFNGNFTNWSRDTRDGFSSPLSLAPGFSRVLAGGGEASRFNGFCWPAPDARSGKPLKRLAEWGRGDTRLKPGANETGRCLRGNVH